MITVIKSYLRGVLASVMEIPEAEIVTDLKEEIGGKLPPYAAILTADAAVETVFERSMRIEKTVGEETYAKYAYTQPVRVLMGGEDEAEVDGWVDEFMSALARELYRDAKTRILLFPKVIRVTDNMSWVRDHYAVAIHIDCEYKLHIDKDALESSVYILT